MLINVSHEGGIEEASEILFDTKFGYMFSGLHSRSECFLRESNRTLSGLHALGAAMADPGRVGDEHEEFKSPSIPAAFTYFGQFIDHDVTARTDRETSASRIVSEGDEAIVPLSADQVVASLTNGRRPQLDLDSVYGDGPGLIPTVGTEASSLYGPGFNLQVNEGPHGYLDLPRDPEFGTARARIADARNDENVMISQLQAAFLKLHNRVLAGVKGESEAERYAKARQLVRWAYQVVVVYDYLHRVCDPGVWADVLYNGPRFYKPGAIGGEVFMPLEFSVAGFRFGHSMIRPFYSLNDSSGEIPVVELLEASSERNQDNGQLRPERVVDWSFFLADTGKTQFSRLMDPKVAQGLFELPFGNCDPVLAHLARRNLMRAYVLKIPTGQACAAAMGIRPLTAAQLTGGEPAELKQALTEGRFTDRTPLWYYVLKEAAVQKGGVTLGAVGSRIVAETLIGLVKADKNSFFNNSWHPSIETHQDKPAIRLGPGDGGLVSDLAGLLRFAQVRPFC